MKSRIRSQHGFTFIPVLVVGAIVSMVLLGLMVATTYDSKRTIDDYHEDQSFYVANAGMEHFMSLLKTEAFDNIQGTLSGTLSTGSYNVNLTRNPAPSDFLVSVVSQGTATKKTTSLTVKGEDFRDDVRVIQRSLNAPLSFGGSDQLSDGSIYSNSSVTLQSNVGASAIYSQGIITMPNTLSIPSYPLIPLFNPPVEFNGLSRDPATVHVTQLPKTLASNKITFIDGDLLLTKDPKLTIDGPVTLVVSGSLIAENGLTIRYNIGKGKGSGNGNGHGYGHDKHHGGKHPPGNDTSGSLSVIVQGDILINGQANVTGYYYAGGTLQFKNAATVHGIVNANVFSHRLGMLSMDDDPTLFGSSPPPYLPYWSLALTSFKR